MSLNTKKPEPPETDGRDPGARLLSRTTLDARGAEADTPVFDLAPYLAGRTYGQNEGPGKCTKEATHGKPRPAGPGA